MSREMNESNDLRKGLPTKFAEHCQRRRQAYLRALLTHRPQSIGYTIDELEALAA
jgi:hypothetical protein